MSVSETEPVAEPETDEPLETEDGELEDDDPEAEPEAGPDEAEALAPPAQTEKEIEKRRTQLVNEAQRHADRIGKILGEDGLGLIQCEACPENTPGWHYPAGMYPPDSSEHALYTMLAGGDGAERKHPAYFVRCEECNGYGTVDTGAQPALLTASIMCPVCKNAGYIDTRTNAGAPEMAAAPINGTVANPPTEPEELPDMWGRPPGTPTFGKLPIFLTPEERASDLAAGYNLG